MSGEIERAACPELRRGAIALYDRFTHEGMDRRAFMAELTRIAGGAAAASLLLSGIAAAAQARPQVAADDPRIATRESEWEAAVGRVYRGYAAAPADTRAAPPMVLVIHENRGLNEHIRDVTRRLAVAGYSALALDFLSPEGGTPADEDRAREMIRQLDLGRAVADAAALVRLLSLPTQNSQRIGAVGFCWGGGFVNRLAVAAGDSLSAGVVFYGPAPPLADAVRVEAPLLIHLAERDERVNATALPWVAALRNAGKEVRAIDYHGVDHAFHNDTSAMRYDRDAAVRAWAETLAFFRLHLNGARGERA